MEQELPKPLVSDDQIIQEEEAWNGSIDGGLKEKLASTYTARWVRDIYESELQRLRAQVKAMVRKWAGNMMHADDTIQMNEDQCLWIGDLIELMNTKHGITL